MVKSLPDFSASFNQRPQDLMLGVQIALLTFRGTGRNHGSFHNSVRFGRVGGRTRILVASQVRQHCASQMKTFDWHDSVHFGRWAGTCTSWLPVRWLL
jgi:hypothetical protein